MRRTGRKSLALGPAALVAGLAFCLFLQGCSPPEVVRTYEYVTDYGRMEDLYEPLLSLAYIPHETDLSRYDGVIVGDLAIGEQWIEERPQAMAYAVLLRLLLRRELESSEQFAAVASGRQSSAYLNRPGRWLRLEGMVTGCELGSGLMRYFSYYLLFLQSGATDFQVEGRILDDSTGEMLVEFADRRRGLYNTPWGPNPKTLRGEFAMTATVRDTARSIVAFLGQAREGLPATPAQDEQTQ
ncbi:MAG: hypothetical protein R6V05_10065 [Candidatus Brocadiia bacterium]